MSEQASRDIERARQHLAESHHEGWSLVMRQLAAAQAQVHATLALNETLRQVGVTLSWERSP